MTSAIMHTSADAFAPVCVPPLPPMHPFCVQSCHQEYILIQPCLDSLDVEIRTYFVHGHVLKSVKTFGSNSNDVVVIEQNVAGGS